MVYTPPIATAINRKRTAAKPNKTIFSLSDGSIFDPLRFATKTGRLIFIALALDPLDLLAVTVNLGLVAIDLLLLLVVGDLMALQLVAD